MLDINEIMKIIPQRPPFLMIDRVEEYVPGESCVAYKNVCINEPHFQGHFPGQPIMPGVLIVEALAQTGAVAILSMEENKEEKQEDYKIVKSPMVGTFYSKSSPDAKPYVQVGSKVKKGDILCIVEAMKLMNEIESEFDGEIVEVCVNDGDMVDYGKPLFKIK